MNQSDQKAASKYGLVAAIAYNILSVLLFPITMIGYVIWVGGAIFAGRRSGVSGTAQGPLSARFFEHELGTRQDEPAKRLMMASQALYWRYARAGTAAAGEPVKFGIDSTPPSRERIAELIGACGLVLVE